VWARATDTPNEYVLDNIPFFAREATLGDRVLVTKRGAQRIFRKVLARSPRSLVRVIFHERSLIDEVRKHLKQLGCSTEYFGKIPIIAVDIPGSIDLLSVRRYLDPLETSERLTYEEPILRD
jgi:hypothetical protein